ncbi:MAG: photosynthetic complex putative assembly protein PuhB [Pseudomonadota bacterium]
MSDYGHLSDEFEVEPVHGLPGRPPAGERILWQGAPDWRALARRCFRTRLAAGWFALLGAWQALRLSAEGAPMREIAASAVWYAGLAVLAVAVLSALAWVTARATVYTITTRRVSMRIGSALTVNLNLPFRWIERADLRVHASGTGDVPLTLGGESRIGYLVLWPHCRPWKMARAQPMLRCVPDAGRVATLLADALRADLARREAEGAPGAAASAAPRPAVPLAARGAAAPVRPIARPVARPGGPAPIPAE